MEQTPGMQTSEGKLTIAALVLGTVLEGIAGVLDQLTAAGHAAGWFTVALLIVGGLLQVCSLLGYKASRTMVKVAAIRAEAAQQIAAQQSPK